MQSQSLGVQSQSLGVQSQALGVQSQTLGVQSQAGSDYFETLGITLLRGRAFSPHDTPNTTPVVLIDEVC